MLRSYLCDYNDADIVVNKGTIDFLTAAVNENVKAVKDVILHLDHVFQKLVVH